MLPNFLIIGAQKAATTWLATCLGEHTDVFIPEKEEIYFFNHKFSEGLEWYESHFERWSGQAAVGEATPGYISHPDASQRIRDTLGDAKLIASLRHPVDRAYSAFWHHIRARQLDPDADFVALFRQDGQFGLRSRGYYFAQLSRYQECFSCDNLLVLIYEETFNDSREAIANCLKFLEVDSKFEPSALDSRVNRGGRDISAFHNQAWMLRVTLRGALRQSVDQGLLPHSIRGPLLGFGRGVFEKAAFDWGPKKRPYQHMDRNLRQELLREYYMSDIGQLEDLLDRDLSVWYES